MKHRLLDAWNSSNVKQRQRNYQSRQAMVLTRGNPRKKWLTVIEGDDVKAVEQLSLVLMNSLDLAVKERHRVHCYPILLQHVLGKLGLVVLKTGASRIDKESSRASRLPPT